jgi:GNAT superfamily N-acetyltransferase
LNPVLVRPLERGHIRGVVDIHLRAFPGYFLTFLGAGFLEEFYRAFLDEETAISRVAVDGQSGDPLGAVIGTDSPDAFFRKLAARRWWAFGLASLASCLKKPSIVRRLFRALTYRGDPPGRAGYALLSSIAVAPEAQNRGIGKLLLEHWAEEARRRDCRGAYLTTDALDNDAVNRFYQRAGWILETSFVTREGRRMNRYVMRFDNGKP